MLAGGLGSGKVSQDGKSACTSGAALACARQFVVTRYPYAPYPNRQRDHALL